MEEPLGSSGVMVQSQWQAWKDCRQTSSMRISTWTPANARPLAFLLSVYTMLQAPFKALYILLVFMSNNLIQQVFFFNFIEGNTESRRVEWVIFLPLSCKVVRMECLRKFEAVAPLLSPVIHQRIYWMKTFKPKEHILNLHAVVYLFRKTTSHISTWLCGQEVLSKISLTWTRVCQYFCSFWPALCFCKDFWWGIHFSQLQWGY